MEPNSPHRSSRGLKICDLTQFYSPVSGGVRRYIEQKSAYLRAHRPDWEHVIIVPGESTGRSGDEKVRVYTIASPLVSRTSRYRILTKLHLIEEVLERERPDLIESGDPYQVAWKAVASGRGLDIPVVGFYHSHFPEAYIRTVAKYFGRIAISITDDVCRSYVKSLYNCFECTFVPSPVLARLLGDWGVERLHTVDLGVDAGVFLPDIPDGNQRPEVIQLREKSGNVQWMPYCTNPQELASIYRAADLFVHPGVQETFGLVALESQASGTCVVGIRGSYMDRIIFSDQHLWAAENSPGALADAIDSKFTLDLRAAGLKASSEARGRYSWSNVFARLFDVYSRVVADFSR